MCYLHHPYPRVSHVFLQVEVAIRRVRPSILDCSKIKNRLDVKREFTPQSKTKTIWQMYSDTNDIWCHPTHPPLPQNKCSQTVIGPMLDVEKALCPHHEVKLTFMKLKSQVGFLCWYGFKRHHCSTLLPLTSCALKLPYPRGMECLETSLLRSNLTYS